MLKLRWKSCSQRGAIGVVNSDLMIDGNMSFTNNSAQNGGAVYISVAHLGIAAVFGILLAAHGERGSTTVTGTVSYVGNSAKYGGALYIENSYPQLIGNVSFERNSALTGGAIYVESGGVTLSGAAIFADNSATRGGGVAVERSARVLFLFPFEVNFHGNKAEVGGAMFVDDSILLCSDHRPSCFFELTATHFAHYSLMDHQLNISLNSASRSGPAIYGGNLEQCQNKVLEKSGIELLGILTRSTPISRADISSDPRKLCSCENGTVVNCTTRSHSVKVKRGELFNMSLITVGQLDTPVPAQILANSDNGGDVQLDPQFPVSDGTCTNVGIMLLADELISNKTLYLYPDGPCGNIDRTRMTVEITLEDCPPGFDLSHVHCVCERRLLNLIDKGSANNFTCDVNNEAISRHGNAWIRPIWDKNNSNYLGFIWHSDCPLGYCKSSQEPIHLDFSIPHTSDSLCSENRHGLLCGACRQNYSLSLHDYSCKACEDKSISLILFFAISGVALIALLLALRMTVASGTINGLILYANIVSVNRDIFFPPDVVNVYPLTVFIAWLNLDFGISLCLYDGLDAYVYAWLQYLFPLYLWCLIGVIILINKLPIKVGGLFGSNPVAVLATVILMSYTKLLQTSIVVLSYTQLDYPDNKTVVWLYDANITYFEGRHIYLAVVAILVIAVLILPYTFLLTFGYRLLAYSNRRYCFWFYTFKPFLDPYYAPFNGNTRYWNGFLLLVRGGLYVSFAINALSHHLLLISLVFLILTAILWLGQRIYVKLYVNILEVSFILNACFLSITTHHVRTFNGNQAVVTYLSVGVTFTEFIGIVMFHLCSHIKDKLPCKKQPDEQRDIPREVPRNHRPPAVEHLQQLSSGAKFRDSVLEMDTY